MCLCGLRFKKHIIFHILYIIVAPLCSAFLKRVHFYKAHSSEKRGVLWLASYPVHCDWPNTSSVYRKCYAPYRIVMPCPARWDQNNKTHFYASRCIASRKHYHVCIYNQRNNKQQALLYTAQNSHLNSQWQILLIWRHTYRLWVRSARLSLQSWNCPTL